MNQPTHPSAGGTLKWLITVLVIIIILGGGYTAWVRYGGTSTNPVTTSVTVTPTAKAKASPSTSPTASASSNKYSNADLGFSFTIPAGYVIQVTPLLEGPEGFEIRFAKKVSETVSDYNFVSLMVYKGTDNLETLKAAYIKEMEPDISKTTPIKIATTDAVKYEVSGLASGFHIVGTNNKLVVTANAYPTNDSSFLDQVISTFQFTK